MHCENADSSKRIKAIADPSAVLDRIAALPLMKCGSNSNAEAVWATRVNGVRKWVLQHGLSHFLHCPIIRQAMFVGGGASYSAIELAYLRGLGDWARRWEKAIVESVVGHPPESYVPWPTSSGNLIHHAYHVARFEEIAQKGIAEFSSVFEFGAGYGSLCRLFFNLGYEGRYVLYDLPIFRELQCYYLSRLGLDISGDGILGQIECVSGLDSLESAVAHCLCEGPSLFIATWSLSESSAFVRQRMLSLMAGFDGFLIAYAPEYRGEDNAGFVLQLQTLLSDVVWHDWRVPHLGGSRYLIGTR